MVFWRSWRGVSGWRRASSAHLSNRRPGKHTHMRTRDAHTWTLKHTEAHIWTLKHIYIYASTNTGSPLRCKPNTTRALSQPQEQTHTLRQSSTHSNTHFLYSNSSDHENIYLPGRRPGRTWVTRWLILCCEYTLYWSFLTISTLWTSSCINSFRSNLAWSSMLFRRGRRV